MKAIYLTHQFPSAEEVVLPVIERPMPKPMAGEALVRIVSSGINPSDARATLGYFANAKWPRIPGRDYAGIVVEGKWKGKHVWGTGGKTGIEADGTHAEYAIIPEAGLAEIPTSLTLLEAGAQTLPFITAYYSLIIRGQIKSGEKILINGALGQVGRAAMSICTWKKCSPVALVRNEEEVKVAQKMGWEAYSEVPKNLTFDAILNSLGTLQWDSLFHSMNVFGRMIIIGALPAQRETQLNLFELYRSNQEIIGINTLDLDHAFNAKLLNEMKSAFESKALIPLQPEAVFALNEATEAYKLVLQGSKGKRVVLNLSD